MSVYQWNLYDSAASSWVTSFNGEWVAIGNHSIEVNGDFATILGRIVLVRKGVE